VERPAPVAVAPAERRGRGLDDKLNTLHDYRHARGLCIRCGEKWSRDHKCPEAVQLHVLQELWEICNSDASDDPIEPSVEEPDEAQVCLAISMSADRSVSSVHSIQFQGTVHGLPARILLDSGSSHTFVSAALAAKLPGISYFSPALRVTVADGSVVSCSTQFQQLQWSVQGCEFLSVAKVFPLTAYDLIIGMDWLSSHSPMQIDWQHKWLLISYNQAQHLLQGDCKLYPLDQWFTCRQCCRMILWRVQHQFRLRC
jgi:hypothetical protein